MQAHCTQEAQASALPVGVVGCCLEGVDQGMGGSDVRCGAGDDKLSVQVDVFGRLKRRRERGKDEVEGIIKRLKNEWK